MSNCHDLHQHRISLHIDWGDLAKLGTERLSAIIGREIAAAAERSEYYHWGFEIGDTPLTKAEMSLLFDTVGASEDDRDRNDFGDYPIAELNRGLSEKVIKPLFPFILCHSLADDDGVWFFGPTYPQSFNPASETSEVIKDGVGIARCVRCATMVVCNDCSDMPATCPGCSRKLDYSAYKTPSNKCRCGNNRFNAHQVSHHDIVTNGYGDFIEDRGAYYGNTPFGPFTCTKCGESYDELPPATQ